MSFYALRIEDFPKLRPWPFAIVDDCDALNRRIARQAVDAIAAAGRAGQEVLMVLPVGPLDYAYWADLCNNERVSCEPLITLSMDEYLQNGTNDYVTRTHPLSFRTYIQKSLIDNLDSELRPNPANVHFPDPHEPQRTTALVEQHGGADFCFGGCGITGHFAFNDPPEPDAPCDDNAVRNSRTRCLSIMRESQVQMCMGGTAGNWEIIPERAVTLGMYELLLSKRIHLTFMRSWHAGVLRRVLFGPVTGRCPASFIQQHPNVEVTMTRLAAVIPLPNVTQAIGDQVR